MLRLPEPLGRLAFLIFFFPLFPFFSLFRSRLGRVDICATVFSLCLISSFFFLFYFSISFVSRYTTAIHRHPSGQSPTPAVHATHPPKKTKGYACLPVPCRRRTGWRAERGRSRLAGKVAGGARVLSIYPSLCLPVCFCTRLSSSMMRRIHPARACLQAFFISLCVGACSPSPIPF